MPVNTVYQNWLKNLPEMLVVPEQFFTISSKPTCPEVSLCWATLCDAINCLFGLDPHDARALKDYEFTSRQNRANAMRWSAEIRGLKSEMRSVKWAMSKVGWRGDGEKIVAFRFLGKRAGEGLGQWYALGLADSCLRRREGELVERMAELRVAIDTLRAAPMSWNDTQKVTALAKKRTALKSQLDVVRHTLHRRQGRTDMSEENREDLERRLGDLQHRIETLQAQRSSVPQRILSEAQVARRIRKIKVAAEEAAYWIDTSGSESSHLSFDMCCAAIGVEPHFLREGLRKRMREFLKGEKPRVPHINWQAQTITEQDEPLTQQEAA